MVMWSPLLITWDLHLKAGNGTAITKWGDHMTSHFMTLSLSNRISSPIAVVTQELPVLSKLKLCFKCNTVKPSDIVQFRLFYKWKYTKIQQLTNLNYQLNLQTSCLVIFSYFRFRFFLYPMKHSYLCQKTLDLVWSKKIWGAKIITFALFKIRCQLNLKHSFLLGRQPHPKLKWF